MLGVFCAVTFFVLFAYGNSFWSEFHFDDYNAIVNCRAIRNPLDFKGIFSLNERPLTNYTFALNYFLGKLNVFGYHLVNILLHILCSALVFIFVDMLVEIAGGMPVLSRRWIALFAALLSAVHPVKVEAVTYISARSEILGSIFYLSALISFMLYAKDKNRSNLYFFFTVLFSLLGMLSKPIVVTLPLMAVLLDYYFLASFQLRQMKKRFPLHLALVLNALIVPLLSIPVMKNAALGFSNPELPSSSIYFLTELRAYLHYLRLLFLPWPGWLNFDTYFPWSRSLWELPTLLSFIVVLSILALAFYLRKKSPMVSFFIFWFFIILIPTSSFMPIEDAVYERRIYLASLGYFILLLLFLRNKDYRRQALFLATLIFLFSFWSWQRNIVWKDRLSLWQDSIKKSPLKSRTHMNLGFYYLQMQDLEKAQYHMRKAILLNPRSANAHVNMGVINLINGNYQEAIKEYNLALQLRPEYPAAYVGRGTAYKRLGLLDLAEKDFLTALSLQPDFAEALANLAILNALKKDFQKSKNMLYNTLKLSPDIPEAYLSLGLILRREKKMSEAIQMFAKAVELNPEYHQARYYLGLSFLENNQPLKAREQYDILRNKNLRLANKLLEYLELYSKLKNKPSF